MAKVSHKQEERIILGSQISFALYDNVVELHSLVSRFLWVMEALHINGQSIKFVDRKLCKRNSYDEKLVLEGKMFKPSSGKFPEQSSKSENQLRKKKCPIEVEHPHKRRILKRPKPFKNYYSDRQPLTIPSFSFPRLGEPFPFRGRQTLCKYFNNNEVLNEQLLQIKSAQTVLEFEKLFSEQLRYNQENLHSAKSLIEPYYDVKNVLNPLKQFPSETCLCTKDLYRLNNNRQASEHQHRTTSSIETTTLHANKSLNDKHSIEDFVSLASECYDKCINIYLDNLNDCNRRADIAERQTIRSPSGYTGKRSFKARKINDLSLANQINKLSIHLDSQHREIETFSLENLFTHRQTAIFPPQNCSHQSMSCNDTNNNSTESTNQLKDPPKIILSDHSTNQSKQGDIGRSCSVESTSTDKNCLTVPLENYYSSEARPP